jgi:hypothetical protein
MAESNKKLHLPRNNAADFLSMTAKLRKIWEISIMRGFGNWAQQLP